MGGLVLTTAIAAAPAYAQTAPPTGPGLPGLPVTVADAADLERLTKPLGAPSTLVLRPQQPRFFSLTMPKLTSIAEDMKNWDLRTTTTTVPSQSNGISHWPMVDVLPLIRLLVRGEHERELNKLRARIDRELVALGGRK